jgi:NADH dehydrogenase
MVAQVAIQQGRLASKNIAALDKHATPRSFRYSDKGQMVIIGQRSALVDGFGLRLRGRLAWLAWLGLHLLNLRGAKNRLTVLIDWAAVYTRRAGGARIITRPEGRRRVDQAQRHVLDTHRQITAQPKRASGT